MLCPNCNSLANAQDMHQNRSEAETHQSTREDLPNRPDDMDGLRAGVRREGVCCGQEWRMAMKDEAGCVDFRASWPNLVPVGDGALQPVIRWTCWRSGG